MQWQFWKCILIKNSPRFVFQDLQQTYKSLFKINWKYILVTLSINYLKRGSIAQKVMTNQNSLSRHHHVIAKLVANDTKNRLLHHILISIHWECEIDLLSGTGHLLINSDVMHLGKLRIDYCKHVKSSANPE